MNTRHTIHEMCEMLLLTVSGKPGFGKGLTPRVIIMMQSASS